MPTVEEVTAKYVELRDRKAEIALRHTEELKPLNDAQAAIESWLLNKMNEDGVDSYKTQAGTPYKAVTTSVKLEDAEAFKFSVFKPAIEQIVISLNEGDLTHDEALDIVGKIIRDKALWDMVDFRAGKKGIQAAIEETKIVPPGVSINSFTAVNIRRG